MLCKRLKLYYCVYDSHGVNQQAMAKVISPAQFVLAVASFDLISLISFLSSHLCHGCGLCYLRYLQEGV